MRDLQHPQRDRLDPQPGQDRLPFGVEHVAGTQLGLAQPQHRQPELPGQRRVAQQRRPPAWRRMLRAASGTVDIVASRRPPPRPARQERAGASPASPTRRGTWRRARSHQSSLPRHAAYSWSIRCTRCRPRPPRRTGSPRRPPSPPAARCQRRATPVVPATTNRTAAPPARDVVGQVLLRQELRVSSDPSPMPPSGQPGGPPLARSRHWTRRLARTRCPSTAAADRCAATVVSTPERRVPELAAQRSRRPASRPRSPRSGRAGTGRGRTRRLV